MNFIFSTRLRVGLVLATAALCTLPTLARGAEKFDAARMAQTIAPYVDGETLAVVHLDISRLSAAPIVATITRFVPDAVDELSEAKKAIAGCLETLRRERVRELYFIVSLGGRGLVPRMSVVLSPQDPTRDLDAFRSALQIPPFIAIKEANQPSPNAPAPARPELADALAAAGDAAAQVVLIPPASSRRVVEELMPQLPPQIGGGPSTVLTHGISWAALAIDLAPTAAVRLEIKSQDAASAEALQAMWLDVLKFAGKQKQVREVAPDFDKVASMLSPKLSGDRLSLAIDEKDAAAAGMSVATQRAIGKTRESAARVRSMNNLKQLALAMWNWNSTFSGHFPAAAIHGKDGKPLLSWRVKVLPFLEQEPLYRQFRLDEPWDSPHNKALIAKMPAVFQSPKSKAAKGFTNYVVPVGGGALYSSPKEEPKEKDITDGTSHTIMLVEVDDAHAVPWTKPDDMPFDPADPKKGIGSLYGQGFIAAFCDGSVHFMQNSIDPKTLKALFTRAGGEQIDFTKF